jgi:hypothetical protein
MLVLKGIFLRYYIKNLYIGPAACWSHSYRHVNRLNLSSDGTYERTLHGLVFRRRGAATCSTAVRGVRSTRYCTSALSALFPKDRNAIRVLGLEFWPETCVCVLWLCSICNSVSLSVNMAFTKPARRQVIAIATPTGGGGGRTVLPWIKLTVFTSIVN